MMSPITLIPMSVRIPYKGSHKTLRTVPSLVLRLEGLTYMYSRLLTHTSNKIHKDMSKVEISAWDKSYSGTPLT